MWGIIDKGVTMILMKIFFLFFGLLVVGFLLLLFKLIMNSKNSSWAGTVVDKKSNVVEDYDTNIKHTYYHLVVDSDKRAGMKVGVSEKIYNEFQAGDKIKKDKGELWPKKA
jgi:hypothetical protein